jgi:hypothetical protein
VVVPSGFVWTRIDFNAHPFDRIPLRLSWSAPLGES